MYDTLVKAGTVIDGTGAAPFVADVAVRAGRIVAIGRADEPAREVIDADGAIVCPGWVDIHTHYDGQLTWDDRLEGSASNGVTTCVMGNCGVGFAPVHPGSEATLIDLMEGVEDIPGSALSEGIPWGEWETFAEYLDVLDRRSWTMDVAAQVAHGPLRLYVMGERAIANLDATEDELQAMATLAADAVRAGAVGFSTSRVQRHLSSSGRPVPGTYAPEHELAVIADGVARAGRAVLQGVPSNAVDDVPGLPAEYSTMVDEFRMFARLSRRTGLPCTLSMMQLNAEPDAWRSVLAVVAEESASGARLYPQVAARPVSMLTMLAGYHLFMQRPTYLAREHLDHTALVAELQRPEVKAAILAEEDVGESLVGGVRTRMPRMLAGKLARTFPFRPPFDLEPDPSASIEAVAQRCGVPIESLMYDLLLEDGGQRAAVVLLVNYADGNLDACHAMLSDPHSVPGLGDAGAHVKFICDMSAATTLLTHWVRDRTRGERLTIEAAVAKQTSRNAALFGLDDRGTVALGKRADLNVIDYERLAVQAPTMVRDLPAGGSRLVQPSTGYLATMVHGELTRRDDADTGRRPGRLVRNR